MSDAAGSRDLLREDAQAALTLIRRTLAESGEHFNEDLGRGVGRLVRLRDQLIERRRAGAPAPEGWLERSNAILSSVLGAEFPIQGIPRERLEMACTALERLLAGR